MLFKNFYDVERYVNHHPTQTLYEDALTGEILNVGVDMHKPDTLTTQEKETLLIEKTSKIYKYVITDRIFEEVVDIKDHIKEYARLNLLLSDDVSREILWKILAFRLSRDSRYIVSAFDIKNEQYFDESLVKLPKQCVFVDCGGFDGDTAASFVCRVPEYKQVFLFEPMKEYAEKCQALFASVRNVDIRNSAVSNQAGFLRFDEGVPGSSAVSNNGKLLIPTVSLDEEVKETIGYIKMDIEGSEIKALQGCRNHIASDAPVMAICVYHLPSDLYEIPFLIQSFNGRYEFHLRHYSTWSDETVVYCVPKNKELYPIQKTYHGSHGSDFACLKKCDEVKAKELYRLKEMCQYLLIQQQNLQESRRELIINNEGLAKWLDETVKAKEYFQHQDEANSKLLAKQSEQLRVEMEAKEYFRNQAQSKEAQLLEKAEQLRVEMEAKEYFRDQAQSKEAQLLEKAEQLRVEMEAKEYFRSQAEIKDGEI